jgi:hypothetical protein
MSLFSPTQVVRLCWLLAIALATGALAGCARPVGSLSGKVTIMNKPLKGGFVTFVSTDGQPARSAQIGEDGTYTIPSITAGNYQIVVETASLAPRAAPMSANRGTPKEGKLDEGTAVPAGYHPSNPGEASIANANANNAKRYVPIPARYAKTETSNLTYEVVGGNQTYNLELVN